MGYKLAHFLLVLWYENFSHLYYKRLIRKTLKSVYNVINRSLEFATFSAVITGAVSLLSGMDVISFEFVCGGVISLIAVILSAVADMKFDNKKEELKPLTSSNE